MSNSKPSSNKVKVSVATQLEPNVESTQLESDTVPVEPEVSLEDPVEDESTEAAVFEPETSSAIGRHEPAAGQSRSTSDIKRVRRPVKPPKASSNASFWIWSTITIFLAGGLIASGWPAAHWYADNTATRLVGEAATTSADQAGLDYHIANLLDSANATAAWHIAASELADGHAQQAADTLQRSSGGLDANFLTTLVRTKLETGDIPAAVKNTNTLATIKNLNDDQVVTIAMAYSLAGEGISVAALEPRVSSPQALERIRQAEAGNVSLADALGASGLLNSSSAILMKLPSSAPRDLRLAKLDAASSTKSDWSAAGKLYQSYLAAMPTDINARLAYAIVLDRLKQPDDANHQRNLVASLQAGRP